MLGETNPIIDKLLGSTQRAALTLGLLLGVAYFGFFFDDNGFYLAFVAIYGLYSAVRANLSHDRINSFFLYLFLIFGAIILLSNLTRIFDFSISEFSGRDWRIAFHPLVVIMIMDAVYSLVRSCKISVSSLAPYLIFSIIGGTLTYVFFAQDKPILDILTIGGERSSGIIERNFNLADDVYFFLTCSLAISLLFLKTNRMVFWFAVIISAAFALYFMLMVVEGQSRAGWLGIVAGVAVALLYGVFHRRYAIPVLMVVGAIIVGFLQFDKIAQRFEHESGIYQEMWAQWQQTGTLDIDELDQDKGLSTYLRLQGYENARVLLTSSPWVGHGGFDTEKLKDQVPYGENLVFIAHAHNIFLDVAIRQGIGVGLVYFVLMVLPIGLSAWMCGRAAKGEPAYYYFAAILMAYAIYVFVENMVDLSYIRSDPGVRIQYLYFALTGIAMAALATDEPIGIEEETV